MGVIIPSSEMSGAPYVCCVKKNEGSNEPSPFRLRGYPAKVSNICLFHFSEGMTLVIVRELRIPREVAIKCLLLSESLPSHMPLANDDSAFLQRRACLEL